MADRFSGTGDRKQGGRGDTALRGPRGHIAAHGSDEQRHAVSALVQGAHETLVIGHGWRSVGEILRDFPGKWIEHDSSQNPCE
jgi:hypothetical protein